MNDMWLLQQSGRAGYDCVQRVRGDLGRAFHPGPGRRNDFSAENLREKQVFLISKKSYKKKTEIKIKTFSTQYYKRKN